MRANTDIFQAFQVDNPIKRTAYSQILVIVEDINDNVPELSESEYHRKIPENMPGGFSVLQVAAHDRDKVRKC